MEPWEAAVLPVADLNWPLAATTYLGYRAARGAYNYFRSNNNMPIFQRRGYKRPRTAARPYVPNKRPRYAPKRFPRFKQMPYQVPGNVVKLQKLSHYTQSGAGDMGKVMRTVDLLSTSGWTKYKNLFEYMKVIKMKLTIFAEEPNKSPIAFTYCTLDDHDLQTAEDVFTRQKNCYTHHLSTDKVNSRTLSLQQLALFRDFFKVDQATTLLDTETGMRASIKLLIPNIPDTCKIQLLQQWTVAFRHPRDVTALDTTGAVTIA